MFDAKKLLDQLVGPQGSAMADQVLGQGKDVLGQGLGMAEELANKYVGADTVNKVKDYVNANPMTTGLGAGGLLGLVLGTESGRAVGGSAAKLSALAMIGGLAYKAFTDWQASSAGATAPAAPPEVVPPHEANETAKTMIVAMINAAKADGVVDPKEYQTILGKASEAGIEPAAQAFLDAELSSPVDMDKVVALATSPAMATQIYAASALAIVPDKASEKAYLKELASRLALDPGLVAEIDRRVAAAHG
jgi:uncharacterized membrane protein YebE (DUF533 family)